MRKDSIYDIKEIGFIPPRYGGVSVSIDRLIRQLTDDGFVVGGFYTSENKDRSIIQSKLFEPELDLSIKHIFFRLPGYLRLLKQYRILHSHYSLEHMYYIWCFLHLLHKKVVITVHNSMISSHYNNGHRINRWFLKKVANNKNVTWIAVSEQAKEGMLGLPVTFKQPIHVIPAYIPDVRVEQGSLSAPLYDYLVLHNRNIVFYGHSFMTHDGKDIYGFRDALTMYSRVLERPDISTTGFILCLAEDNDVQKIKELHEIASELGIDDKVYWQIGPIKKMNALWEKADVYVRPTCTDGDSVAVREALDMGVRVVASDVCVRPTETVTYEYGNMDAFVNEVVIALSKGKGDIAPDFSNYEAIKRIYIELLKK